jgi:hypothetical protein
MQKLIPSWRVGDRVDDGIGFSQLPDDLFGRRVAAVVARFADEQDGAAIVVFTLP